GTYNHVNNVADMAYEAIKEIGGNAELAKVGGLYHDIGKIEHPEYFVENQQKDSHNAHDDIKSSLSAAVLKSHVKLGVEKGKEIGLPQEVIDIIYQHHGNDVIQYFYNEAKKEVDQNKNPYGVNEDDFRYNADPPQSREAAAVMLADCFEAASRTLDRPTRQRYENFFNSILVGKITRSQLNDCGLTMNDLDTIKRVFIHEAIARDHHRIKYDNDKSDKKE
nr:HDIG domain-containing protein [Sphaerochaetaceae bacterium]